MAQTILITGASSGIGRSTAQYFHDQGWNVVATMRSPEKETELGKLDRVLVTRLDVLDAASIDAAIAAGIERFGSLDVLLNNAGYGAGGPLEATPMANVKRQFDVNVIGLIETIKAVLPHFREKQSGTIVNISSVGGRITMPLFSLYHGTKWAVEGLSESLTFELAPLGIRVKVVEPGAIKTDFGTRSLDFNNDESLTQYQPTVESVMGTMMPMMDNAAEPTLVAKVIHEAINDESDRLRYAAGEDAEQWLAGRAATDDETFRRGIREQFGL